jgi:hypothetical protein
VAKPVTNEDTLITENRTKLRKIYANSYFECELPFAFTIVRFDPIDSVYERRALFDGRAEGLSQIFDGLSHPGGFFLNERQTISKHRFSIGFRCAEAASVSP